MSLKRRSLRYVLPVAINFISVFMSFFIRAYLAKALSATAFGAFTIWYNNALLFGGLGTVGAQTYAIKELAKTNGPQESRSFQLTLNILISILVFSLVLGVLGAVFQTSFQNLHSGLGVSLIGAVISYAILTVLSSFHRSFNFFGLGMSFDRLFYQIGFIILLFSPFAYFALDTAETSFTLLMIAATIASLIFYWSYIRSHQLSDFKFDGLKANAQQYAVFFLSFVFFVINGRYMLSMSGVLLSGDYLGEISFLFTLFATLPLITVTMNLVIGPLLAKWTQQPQENGNYKKIMMVLVGASALIVIAAIFMALVTPWVYQLFDLKLTTDNLTIIIFAVSAAIKAVLTIAMLIRQMGENLRPTLIICLSALALKIVVGYFAMKDYGLLGLSIVDIVLTLVILVHIMLWISKLPNRDLESANHV